MKLDEPTRELHWGAKTDATPVATPTGVCETEADAAIPIVPGYEITGMLGRGGMGVVYAATQLALKRPVALKMILANAHASSADRVRFRTEAQAVARLQHPNVVQIHDVSECDGKPFLCLELVAGGTLQGLIATTKVSEREAARLVEKTARAVHYVHAHGIVHRDLKPSNVLLTPDGEPKVTDFGLAKLTDAEGGLTRTETFLGTANYVPPEQAAGDTKKIGPLSDVYSLGAILYELLTGRPPFHGGLLLRILEKVRTQQPEAPRRFRGELSADLETICLKCLEKEPRKRYGSAEELADDLRRFLDGKAIQARPVPAWQRTWRAARQRPALLAKVAVALVLTCAVLGSAWHFRVARTLASHEIDARHQQFLTSRNDAIFYWLLTAHEGGLSQGPEAEANWRAMATAARKALALAGVNLEAKTVALDARFADDRREAMTPDCYALLLMLSDAARLASIEANASDQLQEAVRLLRLARDLGLRTRAAHHRYAAILAALGRHEEATREQGLANSLAPQGALDYFLMGVGECGRGRIQDAIPYFHRALALQPTHYGAQFSLAVCHMHTKEWEAAKADLNACLAQQPDHVWAYLYRSFANEELRLGPEARADFQRALELDSGDAARYVIFLKRGVLHFQQDELDHAAGDFEEALRLKPEQYSPYVNLARIRLAQGRLDEAATLMEQAQESRAPVQVVVDYHHAWAMGLLKHGRHADAAKVCAAALERFPDQPSLLEALGIALVELGRHAEAEKALDECQRLVGKASPNLYRVRGRARVHLGKYPEAIEDYARALEIAPSADVYQHRGWAHFFADAWKLAHRDFAKAIELAPATSDAYVGRGLALVKLGQYREAIADADLALRRQVNTPEMMHNVACIHALAAVAAEADHAGDELGLACRVRALEAVERTLELVAEAARAAFWRDKVHSDTALKSIRDETRFQRLREKYGQPE